MKVSDCELKRLDKDQGYHVAVNDYVTSRKKNTSIYKTGVNKLTIKVAGDKQISIHIPKGIYKLTDLALYEEDYQSLTTAKQKSEQQQDIPFTWAKNKINVMYDNEANEKYMTLPVPYEKGWKVYINGQESDLLMANYTFIGVPLQTGINQIEFVYHPPYFFISPFITIFSLILVLILRKMELKKLVPNLKYNNLIKEVILKSITRRTFSTLFRHNLCYLSSLLFAKQERVIYNEINKYEGVIYATSSYERY